MAHARSTTRPHDDGTVTEGEGAVAERGVTSEGCDSRGSPKRTQSVQASDAGSHSWAGDDCDEGSHTWSYYFRPSTVTIRRIKEMIDCEYFTRGVAHVSGEETILEANGDEVVVFEELFTTGLKIPPHPVLSDILLKFQVQLHQLTPNAVGQLSKYI
jgi:hypothetical protein